MKITIEINKAEENMLKILREKDKENKTLEEYANNFFHNNLWYVYDTYYKEERKKAEKN